MLPLLLPIENAQIHWTEKMYRNSAPDSADFYAQHAELDLVMLIPIEPRARRASCDFSLSLYRLIGFAFRRFVLPTISDLVPYTLAICFNNLKITVYYMFNRKNLKFFIFYFFNKVSIN